MTGDGSWDDLNCSSNASFVCQGAGKSRETNIKFTFETNADMTMADHKAQILDQLHEVLLSQGLTDINLSWMQEPQPIPVSNDSMPLGDLTCAHIN
ncbi:unnamed protein product [Boreogadus saida]